MASTSQTVRTFVTIANTTKNALWHQPHSVEEISEVLRSATDLQVQITVRLGLETGLGRLREHSNQSNDQRIKNFIKFTFNSRGVTVSHKKWERRLRLRQLDPFSLVFCGLAYTVRDIENMRPEHFAFLISNVATFVEIHQLSDRICRGDTRKSVMSCMEVETDDHAASKAFFKSYFDAYFPLEQRSDPKSDASPAGLDDPHSPAQTKTQFEPFAGSAPAGIVSIANNSAASAKGGAQSDPVQPRSDTNQLVNEYLIGQTSNVGRDVVEVSTSGNGHIYELTAAARHTLNVLDTSLSSAIRNSSQWRLEEQQGMPRTHCVSMIVPENPRQDVLIRIWIGHDDGFRISSDLDLRHDST